MAVWGVLLRDLNYAPAFIKFAAAGALHGAWLVQSIGELRDFGASRRILLAFAIFGDEPLL